MKVIKIVLAVLLLMAAVGGFMSKEILPSIIMLVLGVLLLPNVKESISKNFKFWSNKVIRYGTYIGLFILASLFIDTDKYTNPIGKEPKPEVAQEQVNEIRLINLNKNYYDADGHKITPDDNDITYKVVEILKHNKNKGRVKDADNEIISFLVEVNEYNEEIINKITIELKNDYATFAPNNCLIDLWDNKKAYQKYLEREAYISKTFDRLMVEFQKTRVPIGDKHNKLKKEWDKKHYSFIADHNLGSLFFSGVFNYFPLQDEYYKEVGGENYKK